MPLWHHVLTVMLLLWHRLQPRWHVSVAERKTERPRYILIFKFFYLVKIGKWSVEWACVFYGIIEWNKTHYVQYWQYWQEAAVAVRHRGILRWGRALFWRVQHKHEPIRSNGELDREVNLSCQEEQKTSAAGFCWLFFFLAENNKTKTQPIPAFRLC